MSLETSRYVKLDLTFGEKIKLLLFGLVREDKLPVREVRVHTHVPAPPTTPTCAPAPPREINTTIEEEKLVIPFFNFNDDDVKSNF